MVHVFLYDMDIFVVFLKCLMIIFLFQHRSTPLHGTPAQSGARENWFSSMPASSSSSSDDEE